MMHSKALLPTIGVMLAVFLAGCSAKETVFARVGDQEIQVEALQKYVAHVTGSEWQQVDRRVASRLMDQYIDQEVVASAARGMSNVELSEDPGARSAMLRSVLPRVCGEAPKVPETRIQEEIDRRKAETRGARAHVRQLLLEDQASAESARERLEAGEDWVAISREVSKTPNAEGGGELGFIEEGSLPEHLDEVIFSLGEGEISRPVEGPVGFHIFQVLEIIPAGPRSENEVRSEVYRELTGRYNRDFAQECLERLAHEAEVEVFRQHLWFEYEGKYAEAADGP